MNNKRILSYCLSDKIDMKDMENISAANSTMTRTNQDTMYPNGGDTAHDAVLDVV